MDKQLRQAASKGQAERVRQLIAQGAEPSAADARGSTPLHLAVRKAHVDAAVALLESGRARPSVARPGGGLSPAAELVLAAAAAPSAALVDLLIGALADEPERAAVLCETDAAGWTVLHRAAQLGNAHLTRLALDAGADAHAVVPAHGGNALMIAAQFGHADVVDVLVGAMAPSAGAAPGVNGVDGRGWSALHWACQHGGGVPIVRALLDAGATLDLSAEGVGTPAMVAAENGHDAILHELIARGAAVDVTDSAGWSALAIAAGRGHARIVERLVEARAAVDAAAGATRRTALMAAAQNGHVPAASALLEARADANARDASGVSALMLGAKNGHLALVERLLQAGALADVADRAGQTALLLCAKSGDARIAARLLDHSARADAASNTGVTPLALAARGGHRELIELLLRAGTAAAGEVLMSAAASAQMDVLLALVKAGGGLIDIDVLGSALLVAAAAGHRAVVTVLVNAGASVFKQDASGLSPLMLASAAGHVDAIRALVKANAPVNAPGGPGANTPLSLAVRNSRAAAVEELLRHGANVDWRGAASGGGGGHALGGEAGSPAGRPGPDLLELAREPHVKAQIVAERNRRALERELLCAGYEGGGGKGGAPRARGARPRVHASAEPGVSGASRDASAPTSPEPAAAASQDGARAADSPRSPPAREGEGVASRFTVAPVSADAPQPAAASEEHADAEHAAQRGSDAEPRGPVTGEAASPGAEPGGAALGEHEPSRFCRTCGTVALRGHRCPPAASQKARAPGEAVDKTPDSWRAADGASAWQAAAEGGRDAAAPGGGGGGVDGLWRAAAPPGLAPRGAGGVDEADGRSVAEPCGGARATDSALASPEGGALSLEELSAQTARMHVGALADARARAGAAAEHAPPRPQLQPPPASTGFAGSAFSARRVQAQQARGASASARAGAMQRVIDMQLETIRKLEEQMRHEKSKLQLLLDMQQAAGSAGGAF